MLCFSILQAPSSFKIALKTLASNPISYLTVLLSFRALLITCLKILFTIIWLFLISVDTIEEGSLIITCKIKPPHLGSVRMCITQKYHTKIQGPSPMVKFLEV